MSDRAFPWVDLRPSTRARRAALGAVVLTAAAAMAAVVAAALAPTLPRLLAAVAVLLGLFAAVAVRYRRQPLQLRLLPEGAVDMRTAGADTSIRLRPVFASAWLIVLADGGTAVAVWPDAVSAAQFRRLAVACRWGRSDPA